LQANTMHMLYNFACLLSAVIAGASPLPHMKSDMLDTRNVPATTVPSSFGNIAPGSVDSESRFAVPPSSLSDRGMLEERPSFVGLMKRGPDEKRKADEHHGGQPPPKKAAYESNSGQSGPHDSEDPPPLSDTLRSDYHLPLTPQRPRLRTKLNLDAKPIVLPPLDSRLLPWIDHAIPYMQEKEKPHRPNNLGQVTIPAFEHVPTIPAHEYVSPGIQIHVQSPTPEPEPRNR
ncbi:hypothetical protein H0H93_007306, partial [Arthromyces matolae]